MKLIAAEASDREIAKRFRVRLAANLNRVPRLERPAFSPTASDAATAAARRQPLQVHVLVDLPRQVGIVNALIQPYSGHTTRHSLGIYSRLALADAQQRYDDVIGGFPV